MNTSAFTSQEQNDNLLSRLKEKYAESLPLMTAVQQEDNYFESQPIHVAIGYWLEGICQVITSSLGHETEEVARFKSQRDNLLKMLPEVYARGGDAKGFLSGSITVPALALEGIINHLKNNVVRETSTSNHLNNSPSLTQHFNAPVASVQTGSHATAHITQHVGANTADVLKLIGELRSGVRDLPTECRGSATELVDAIEEEARSSAPRKTRVKAYLTELNSFAMDTATKSLATSIAKYLCAEQPDEERMGSRIGDEDL